MSEIATTNMLPAVVTDDPLFDQMTRQAYLPRIELFSGSRKPVKAGKFTANHWGMIPSKDKIVDLGLKVLIYPLAYRFLSMDFTDLKKVTSSYDPHSPEFARMKAEAGRKDRPQGQMSPCSFGFQFLVVAKDVGFVTYFMSTPSAKSNAQGMKALIYKFGELSSYFKEQGPYSWQNPEVTASNSTFELPDTAEMTQEINEFNAYKVASVTTEKDDIQSEDTIPDTGRPR